MLVGFLSRAVDGKLVSIPYPRNVEAFELFSACGTCELLVLWRGLQFVTPHIRGHGLSDWH